MCWPKVFLTLNLRFPEASAFSIQTLSNTRLLLAFLWAIIGTLLISESSTMRQIFQLAPLSAHQFEIALVPGIILLIGGEIFKLILRARHGRSA